jgi:hypothetical protein
VLTIGIAPVARAKKDQAASHPEKFLYHDCLKRKRKTTDEIRHNSDVGARIREWQPGT